MNKLICRFLTVGLVALGLTACGSKKETNNNASTVPRGTLPPLGNSQYAECTNVAPNNMYLTAQIASYYYNGSSNNEFVQMNIAAVPAEFYSQGYYIQIHRFREQTAGARQYNEIPVPMYLVNKLSGSFASNTQTTSLSRTVFEDVIEANGLDNLDITATNFLDNFYILLTGMEFQWEAVQIRLMNGSNVITTAEALLPPFYADPNVYASRVPVPALQGLHPLITSASSGASEAEFKRL